MMWECGYLSEKKIYTDESFPQLWKKCEKLSLPLPHPECNEVELKDLIIFLLFEIPRVPRDDAIRKVINLCHCVRSREANAECNETRRRSNLLVKVLYLHGLLRASQWPLKTAQVTLMKDYYTTFFSLKIPPIMVLISFLLLSKFLSSSHAMKLFWQNAIVSSSPFAGSQR